MRKSFKMSCDVYLPRGFASFHLPWLVRWPVISQLSDASRHNTSESYIVLSLGLRIPFGCALCGDQLSFPSAIFQTLCRLSIRLDTPKSQSVGYMQSSGSGSSPLHTAKKFSWRWRKREDKAAGNLLACIFLHVVHHTVCVLVYHSECWAHSRRWRRFVCPWLPMGLNCKLTLWKGHGKSPSGWPDWSISEPVDQGSACAGAVQHLLKIIDPINAAPWSEIWLALRLRFSQTQLGISWTTRQHVRTTPKSTAYGKWVCSAFAPLSPSLFDAKFRLSKYFMPCRTVWVANAYGDWKQGAPAKLPPTRQRRR